MSWFLAIAVGVVLALAAVFFLMAKRHDAGTIVGRFSFDGYKARPMHGQNRIIYCNFM